MGLAKAFLRARNEAGMMLMNVLIGMGLLAIFVGFVMSFASSTLKSAKTVADLAELEDLRRLIRVRMNCFATKQRLVIDGNPVLLYGRDDNPIMTVKETNKLWVSPWLLTVTPAADYATSGILEVEVKDTSNVARGTRKLFTTGAPLVCSP